ncbi:hypothetical protein TNCV_4269641 [Trichonephila clavipes]|nr:hypothetical protein TNCV_4269641 [Trichonephila clavipes]
MRPKITSGPGALPGFILAMAASSSSIKNGMVKIFLYIWYGEDGHKIGHKNSFRRPKCQEPILGVQDSRLERLTD